VPVVFDKIRRAERVTVRALNASGETVHSEAEGLLAVCIQHEIDHLEGKVFVDYLSRPQAATHCCQAPENSAPRCKRPRFCGVAPPTCE
jgi:peptide deformylase